jgi:hypothetical protein
MVDLDGRARRKLRRDEYDQMVIAGLLDGKHVELIRGSRSPIWRSSRGGVGDRGGRDLAYDLGAKATLYAERRYWVIDLGRSLVHVHRGRMGGRWTSVTTLGADDHVALDGLAGSTLAEVLRDA